MNVGSVPNNCRCLIRPPGPGLFADFYGESAAGTWEFDFDAFTILFSVPFEIDQACLRFYECGPERPDSLACEGSGSDVQLSWVNAGDDDEVEVFRDKALIAILDGDATSYRDRKVTPGAHEYGVLGTMEEPSRPESGARIVSIDLAETVATARVEITGWLGHRFTDQFTLLKENDAWTITSKVFHAH